MFELTLAIIYLNGIVKTGEPTSSYCLFISRTRLLLLILAKMSFNLNLYLMLYHYESGAVRHTISKLILQTGSRTKAA